MAFICERQFGDPSCFGAGPSAAGRLSGYGVFWLKALRQPTIDLTIRTHTGLITRIVEFPGLSLSEAELGALVAQLRIVAAKTLPAGKPHLRHILRRSRKAVARHRHADIGGSEADVRSPSTRCR